MFAIGALQIKHKVQLRTLRQTHSDSHYCAALFKYIKGIILQLSHAIHEVSPGMVVKFLSMDDKAKVQPQPMVVYFTCVVLCMCFRLDTC